MEWCTLRSTQLLLLSLCSGITTGCALGYHLQYWGSNQKMARQILCNITSYENKWRYFVFCIVWGSFLKVLRAYSWPCAQGALLEGLQRPYRVPGFEFWLKRCKNLVITTVLSFGPARNHLSEDTGFLLLLKMERWLER